MVDNPIFGKLSETFKKLSDSALDVSKGVADRANNAMSDLQGKIQTVTNKDKPVNQAGSKSMPNIIKPEPTKIENQKHLETFKSTSALDKISDAVRKMADSAFGLSKDSFDKATLAVSGIQAKYKDVAKKDKRFGINQHVPGITMNVRGQEQLIHEHVQAVNVDLPDGRELEKKRGLYLDDESWSPQPKGKLE